MNKVAVKVALITFLFYSCDSRIDECQSKINTIIPTMDEVDVTDLYGFSAESTWRQTDESGNRRVFRIVYTNENKRRISIPSFQNLENSPNGSDSLNDLDDFALELGRSQFEGKEVAQGYADKIVELINRSDIKGIQSQKHLGDFVEFELVTGCSVWFKENGADLSEELKKEFNSAYMIHPNWYILNRGEESGKLIELFKESSN